MARKPPKDIAIVQQEAARAIERFAHARALLHSMPPKKIVLSENPLEAIAEYQKRTQAP